MNGLSSDLHARSRASTAETESNEGQSEPAEASLLVSSQSGCFDISLVPGKRYVIGRALECDIVVDDASVSRRHAAITFGPRTLIEDLGSTNGTRVQGQSVVPGAATEAETGLVLELGSAVALLHRPLRAADAAWAAAAAERPDLVVRDPAMQQLYAMLDVVGPTMLSVLLLGETGVGKEVLAEELVRRSSRRGGPFVRINCAALPESLLEAELFGFEKGAFTGATQARKGLFEAAHTGTLFLDEVGEMAPGTQTKLLRALESGEILRLGSTSPIKIDVRVISASNRNLRALVADQAFRPDVFFRLNGISLNVPPLRSRPADILPLARRFLAEAGSTLGKKLPRIDPEVEQLLLEHPWPGNVRELRNVITRAAVLSRGGRIRPADLLLNEVIPLVDALTPPSDQATVRLPLHASAGELRGTMHRLEREQLVEALTRTQGNQTRAAELLGISRRTLIKKMIRHEIERPRAKRHTAQ